MTLLKVLGSLLIVAIGAFCTYLSARSAWEFGIFPALVKLHPERYPDLDWIDRQWYVKRPLWEWLVIAFGFGSFAPFFLWNTLIALGLIWGLPFAKGVLDGRSFNIRPAHEVLFADLADDHRHVEKSDTTGRGWVKNGERNEQGLLAACFSGKEGEQLLFLYRREPTMLTGLEGDPLVIARDGEKVERRDSPFFDPRLFGERLSRRPRVNEPGEVGDRVQAHVQQQEVNRACAFWIAPSTDWGRAEQQPMRGEEKVGPLGELALFPHELRLFAHPLDLAVGHNGQADRSASNAKLDRQARVGFPSHEDSLRSPGINLRPIFTEKGGVNRA